MATKGYQRDGQIMERNPRQDSPQGNFPCVRANFHWEILSSRILYCMSIEPVSTWAKPTATVASMGG